MISAPATPGRASATPRAATMARARRCITDCKTRAGGGSFGRARRASWPPLAPFIGRLAGPLLEERADRVAEVVGPEQCSRDLGDERVRGTRAALHLRAHEPLGRGVRARRALGEAAREGAG